MISKRLRPAWQIAVGTATGYAILLLLMFVALFLVPYLIFVAL